MGKNISSCASFQCHRQAFDDELPDRIRRDSSVPFDPQKVVTTISRSSFSHSHRKRRKKTKTKTRSRLTHSLIKSIHELSGTKSVLLTDFSKQREEEYEEYILDKTFVLYQQGYVDGMSPIQTITTEQMSVMDIRGSSDILTNSFHLNHLISRSPPKCHCMTWKLSYSLLNDGVSLSTFYSQTANIDQSILIVQDDRNNLFGAYLDSQWMAECNHYNGSRDCFVFRFAFENNEYSIFEYHATGHKPYYLQSDSDGITIGAGECPAIYIQNDLLSGRTTKSETFDNELLVIDSDTFQIQNIEIWSASYEFMPT